VNSIFDPANLRRRLRVLRPTPLEWRWCLYDAANSAFSLIVMTTLFPLFYAQYVLTTDAPPGAATAGVGFANAAAGFAAALAMPSLGALADRRNARRAGVWCAVIAGCLCTLLLNLIRPGMTTAAQGVYAMAVFAFASGNVCYDSMLVDVTTRSRMDYVSGMGFAVGYIGSVIPFLIVLAAIFRIGAGAQGFHFAFTVTALWWAAWSLPLLLARLNRRPSAAPTAEPHPLRQTLRRIWSDRNIRSFLCAYFLYIDGVDTIIVMSVPYGAEVGLGAKELIAVIIGIQVVAFPCALAYGALAARFGAKRMLLFGIACYGATVVAAALLPVLDSHAAKLALFLLLALSVAANQGGIQALSRSCFGRIIPAEYAAEYFGFYNIFGKFAAVLGPLIVGLSGWLLGGGRFGILSLLGFFGVGAWLLRRTRID